MTFEDLGWRGEPGGRLAGLGAGERLGRVAVEHRGGYLVVAPWGETWAETAGRLRHDLALGLAGDRPAVGDWVIVRGDGGRSQIRAVLPRRGVFVRKEAGRAAAPQVVASNVDAALLVDPCDALNPRRLERYVSLAAEGGVAAVVVVAKIDLAIDDEALSQAIDSARRAAPGRPVHAVSARTGEGLDALDAYFGRGDTVALLGPSGVGKSSLINRLLGRDAQRVQDVRGDGKGRHTTTHRELIPRPGGGLVIDTPGMRELGLWASDDGRGVASAFPEIDDLAASCRFSDCSHETEPGCAVRSALASGALPAERLASYRKLLGELEYLEVRDDPEAARKRKKRWRDIHMDAYRRADFERRTGWRNK
jgi:ribosome biogenesis GTPase